MNDIIKDLENIKNVKRCPKCNGLSLIYVRGKLICEDCGYQADIPDIR